MRNRLAWVFVVVTTSGCSLNPQPLPPDTNGDSGLTSGIGMDAGPKATLDGAGAGGDSAGGGGSDGALFPPDSSKAETGNGDGSVDAGDGAAALDGSTDAAFEAGDGSTSAEAAAPDASTD